MFSTLVIGILGVSRLFQKLSVKGIAPQYLSKLISIDNLFGNKENYENNVNENVDQNNNDSDMFDKMPIPALTIFVTSFLLTFVKGGVLELMANATNSMLFFIFSTVNLLVIVNYFKTRNDKEKISSSDESMNKFLHIFPWYAVIGFVLALIFLVISPSYYKLK